MVARAFSGRSRPSVKKGGGEGGSHPDPEIQDGSPVSKKNFVWTFRSQFGVKIRGGGVPRPLPWIHCWHGMTFDCGINTCTVTLDTVFLQLTALGAY